MWQLTSPVWEVVLRATLIYAGVFLLFRFVGKKQLGELSPFDFVLMVIVSESVSNGLGAQENSLTGALISAATLLSLSRFIDYAAMKSRRIEKWVDGEAEILVKDGKIMEKVRKSACLSIEEIMSALRQYEVQDLSELKFAILETNGKISIVKK